MKQKRPAHRRWRAWLALGTSLTGALVWLAGSLGGVTATLSDQVTGAATLDAGTLPAPVAAEAELTADLNAVEVSWSSAPGDFAIGWEVARHDSACADWSDPVDEAAEAAEASPYLDAAVVPGATYCYAVRGTLAEWRSPFTTPGPATEVYIPTFTRLFTHEAGPVLRETPGTGSHRFGCLASVLTLCVQVAPSSYTFASEALHEISSNAGWHASLALESEAAVALGVITVTVHVWHTDGTCAAAPQPDQRIASGSVAINVPLLGTVTGTYPVALAPDAGFVRPVGDRTLCTEVHSSDPSLLGVLFTYDLVHGATSWVEGRFEP